MFDLLNIPMNWWKRWIHIFW